MTLRAPDGSPVAAVVLAGGRARRMGGTDKLALVAPDGRTVLDLVLAAVSGADPLVVVGPDRDGLPPGGLLVREEPPFGGPAAALAAALPLVPTPWVLVLAGDQPRVSPGVAALLAALPASSGTPSPAAAAPAAAPADADPAAPSPAAGAGAADGAVLVDADGRIQWLAGCYRTAALRAALAERDLTNAPLRPALAALEVARVADVWGASDDVDDPADARRLLSP